MLERRRGDVGPRHQKHRRRDAFLSSRSTNSAAAPSLQPLAEGGSPDGRRTPHAPSLPIRTASGPRMSFGGVRTEISISVSPATEVLRDLLDRTRPQWPLEGARAIADTRRVESPRVVRRTRGSVWGGSTSAVMVQTVKAIPAISLTSTPNPSSIGQVVTFTVCSIPNTSGAVGFLDGTNGLGVGVPSSVQAGVYACAAFSTNTLSVGAHSVTARYADGSTSLALVQTVNGH